MRRAAAIFSVGLACWLCVPAFGLANQPTAAQLAESLRSLSIDPDQSFHVRDVHLRRGDVSFYLNEGLLVFAQPVSGRGIAAIFTTSGVEAGDAEMIVMPSRPAERASLASFTETPNLDEHFDLAVFFFADRTREEILGQLAAQPQRKDPTLANSLQDKLDAILRRQGSGIETLLVRGLLDAHKPENGMFVTTVLGRDFGAFQFLYQPEAFEPLTIGRVTHPPTDQSENFQLWTTYRPRQLPPYTLPRPSISDYRLQVALDADLAMDASAEFTYRASAEDGHVIALNLSPLLAVTSARVNGQPAELEQNQTPAAPSGDRALLLICAQPLEEGNRYRVEVHYRGNVVKRVENAFLVQDRNLWYPHISPMLTSFDMQFQCPEHFRLVGTGELVEEHVANHLRFVHRRTVVPAQLAGFNVGEYTSAETTSGPYHIETYADSSASKGSNQVPQTAAAILAHYSKLWGVLPVHSLAVTPVPGYFGQGFPGLIYLSNVAYIRPKERPLALRNQSTETFFSRLLLSHEISHQWWGNLVTAADYRTNWLMEAMASYSALEWLEQQDGTAALNQVFAQYRADLLSTENGKPVEAYGPVDFGTRLLDSAGERAWHVIVYEKGAWVLHMLRQHLGTAAFLQLQLAVLHNFADKPISNEDFRRLAASFLPPKDADKTLTKFFETWVYGTGVPTLQIKRSGGGDMILAAGVDESFTARVPLRCHTRNGVDEVRWQTVVSGENNLLARSGEHCELPRPEEFLYVPK